MVESICGQGFAYVREVEEDWAKHLVKLGLEKAISETAGSAAAADQNQLNSAGHLIPFIGGQ
jgi:hypothetical protein